MKNHQRKHLNFIKKNYHKQRKKIGKNMTTLMTNKTEALAKYLECEATEVIQSSYDEKSFEACGKEFLVLTEEEAIDKAVNYIENTLWAFRTSFLIDFIPSACSLSNSKTYELEKCISQMQEKMCEDCNDILKALIGKRLKELVNAALSNDPIENFLATYDHKVCEEGEFLIYRTN
jgi:hypothetical protein